MSLYRNLFGSPYDGGVSDAAQSGNAAGAQFGEDGEFVASDGQQMNASQAESSGEDLAATGVRGDGQAEPDGSPVSEEAQADQAEPEQQLSPEERFKAELEDIRLRSAAEMENFKKRLTREHQEQLRYASETVLSDLLPTLDNLDLALQFGSDNEACAGLLQGVAMTHKLLLEMVGKHGLVPVGEEGEEFTPERHEGVGVEKREDIAQGAVSKVLQRGYKLGDRLLRPAKVLINQ